MLTLKWLHSPSHPDGLDEGGDDEGLVAMSCGFTDEKGLRGAVDSSPHGALFHWVHGRTPRTVENTGELVELGHAADHSAA